ncbi:MAG: ABC transporter ATP-binding protein [Clostridiales bacterium]|nr:ABC transporter ATP-binding protein [Clostridiales bacterium]
MRVNKVTGGYPGGFALKDISFSVDAGKVYALLGLNGSGKTTIIKIILGLLEAWTGNIYAADRDILVMKERDRAKIISYVPQYSDIVFDISVIDVVLMGVSPYLKIFQTPGRKYIDRAYYYLGILGIENLAHSNYQVLSGGQKQLVIIARALLQNGRYILMDEPESSLDLVHKNMLMRKIRGIAKDYKKGCLISMHNPEYALNFCDNIILINDGLVTELDLTAGDMSVIGGELSKIYGDIEIVEYGGKYFIYQSHIDMA